MGGRGAGSGKADVTNYIEPKSDAAIDQLNNDLTSKEWLKSLSGNEMVAINQYTQASYEDINLALRNDNYALLDEDAQKQVQNISSGIGKYQLKENVIAYRGASLEAFEGGLSSSNLKSWIGSTITDNGFMSTSINPKVANKFTDDVVFKIKAPKGSNAAYINNISHNKSEMELLFDRGTQMKITGITKKGDQYVVDVSVVKK